MLTILDLSKLQAGGVLALPYTSQTRPALICYDQVFFHLAKSERVEAVVTRLAGRALRRGSRLRTDVKKSLNQVTRAMLVTWVYH